MRYQLALSAEMIDNTVSSIFSGVGLVRGEYILRKAGIFSTHSQAADLVRGYLDRICGLFPSQPVWYRFAELEVAEANVLAGVDRILPVERNPVVGLRGIRRAMKFPDAFRAEVEAIIPCVRQHPNLGVLIPFASDPSEVAFAKAELALRNIFPHLGVMAEIPAVILRLEEFLQLGVECVLIGMNDLTGLTLGIERGSDKTLFRHPALRELIGMARAKTASAGVTLSVAGYVDRPFLQLADGLGVDFAVLHYSFLEEYFPGQFRNLPERNNLQAIKRKTREMIADIKIKSV